MNFMFRFVIMSFFGLSKNLHILGMLRIFSTFLVEHFPKYASYEKLISSFSIHSVSVFLHFGKPGVRFLGFFHHG